MSAEAVFTEIADTNTWRGRESVSGYGSDLEQTRTVRRELPELLAKLKVTSLLDAPCGDFHWMRHAALPDISYIGLDIVSRLVEDNQRQYGNDRRRFAHSNIAEDSLPSADLILCRDCLIHLSYEQIARALANFRRSGARFLLTTTYPRLSVNCDIVTGRFRPINLELAPFFFPPPRFVINEDPPSAEVAGDPYFEHCLGLWAMDDLPTMADVRTSGEPLRDRAPAM